MSKFKPGDPALVIGGQCLLGQQVEVVRWVDPGDVWLVVRGEQYYLNPNVPTGGWVVTDSKTAVIKLESHLMPLAGPAITNQLEREESISDDQERRVLLPAQ